VDQAAVGAVDGVEVGEEAPKSRWNGEYGFSGELCNNPEIKFSEADAHPGTTNVRDDIAQSMTPYDSGTQLVF
jgi:hypothetical protein